MPALPASLTIAVLGVPGAQATAVDALLADSASEAAGEASARPRIVVDASPLNNFDSSAIALLLQAQRQAQAGGRSLRVQSPPRAMVELASLYGVAELLGLSLNDAKADAKTDAKTDAPPDGPLTPA